MTLIIIEGSNGAGKSAFAERIALELKSRFAEDPVERYHRGPPSVHPVLEYSEPLWDYVPDANRHIICERWHVGEQVYPELLHRDTQLTPGVLLWLEMFLRARGALLVHVTGRKQQIRDQFTNRDREHWQVVSSQVPEIVDRFTAAVMDSTLRKIEVTNVFDPDAAVFVVDEAIIAAKQVAHLSPFQTYIGPEFPGAILLGERRGQQHELAEGPAFGPLPGTSGQYLMEALAEQPGSVPPFGIANTCDVDDVFALWHATQWPTLIPLGDRARRRLRELGLPQRGRWPHPQFVRRFMHTNRSNYGAALAASLFRPTQYGWDRSFGWRPDDPAPRRHRRRSARNGDAGASATS